MTEQAMRVTTETVQDAIERFVNARGENRFTTADIARFMGAEEYPVRAAFSWLNRNRLIEIVPGVRTRRYLPQTSNRRWEGDWYSVSVYQVVDKCAKADFDTLNRVFCRG